MFGLLDRRPSFRRGQYPSDLARLVCTHWGDLIGGEYTPPPLPPPEQVRTVVDTCFLASLEQEEGRPLQFRVCCVPTEAPLKRQDGDAALEVWRFGKPRRICVPELRKLAPVADINSTSILVEYDNNETRIAGLVNAGSEWESSRRGFGYNRQSPPNALNMRVDGPGRLAVFQGGFLFARLAEGVLSRPTLVSSMEFAGFNSVMETGLASLRERINRPKREPAREYSEFEFHSYLNVFVAIANTIEASRHGGTLVIATDEHALKNQIRSKFSMISANLGDQFINFLNKRNQMTDEWYRVKGVEANMGFESYVKYREALTTLSRTAAFVGRLAAVDGAVVMSADLRLIGFGAEILLEGLPAVDAWELKEADDLFRNKKKKRLNSEQYGMRHRSAMRLCGQLPGIAALVVSQDGGINAVFTYGGKLYFRRNINAVNTVMIGA